MYSRWLLLKLTRNTSKKKTKADNALCCQRLVLGIGKQQNFSKKKKKKKLTEPP